MAIVETGTVGAVYLVAAIGAFLMSLLAMSLSLFANFYMAVFGMSTSRCELDAAVAAPRDSKKNVVRSGMLAVLSGGLIALAAFYLLAYYKVGTIEIINHDLKVTLHNWTYFVGAALFHVATAVILATAFHFRSQGATLVLVMFFVASMGFYGAGQLQGFGSKRDICGAFGVFCHVMCVFVLWYGNIGAKSRFYSVRGWASILPILVAAIIYVLFWFIGSPNEPSSRATLDSRSGTILAFLLGGDMMFLLANVMAIVLYMSPEADDKLSAARAIARRRAKGPDGQDLTPLNTDMEQP